MVGLLYISYIYISNSLFELKILPFPLSSEINYDKPSASIYRLS